MNTTQTGTAALILAALFATACIGPRATAAAPLTEQELKELQANEDPASLWTDGDWWRDEKKWQRKWDRMWHRWKTIFHPQFEWTKQQRLGKGVIVLDPPMAKIADTDRVWVEFFKSPIDETAVVVVTDRCAHSNLNRNRPPVECAGLDLGVGVLMVHRKADAGLGRDRHLTRGVWRGDGGRLGRPASMDRA